MSDFDLNLLLLSGIAIAFLSGLHLWDEHQNRKDIERERRERSTPAE